MREKFYEVAIDDNTEEIELEIDFAGERIAGGGGSGAVFIPSVDDDGNLSWSNDGDLPNPETVNIKGPRGEKGEDGYTPQKGVDYFDGQRGEKGDPFTYEDFTPEQLASLKGDPGVSGVYVGSGDMPDGYNIQIDPEGSDVSSLVLSVNGVKPDKQGNVSIQTGGGAESAVLYTPQTLTEEQKAQARKNIGADYASISILDSDPTGEDLTEGRIWILRVGDTALTTPVIELGNVSNNSIEIKLSNASYDENGDVVTTYSVYVDSVLNKTATIVAGGTCVIDGLYPETKYRISVRGVKDTKISKMSNILTATTLEQESKILVGYTIGASDNELGVSVQKYPARAVYVATSGDKQVSPTIDGVQYYLVEVPEDAISCTVSCYGLMWGFNGWNTGSDGKLTYDVDSGWKDSGATYLFEAGTAEYVTIGFKKKADGTEAITQEDVAGITISFGTNSEPKILFVLAFGAAMNGGNIQLSAYGNQRATGCYPVGEKAMVDERGNDTYYPIPVPADATSVTVTCPNLMYGYCGYNLSAENNYSYDVDSGWKASGVTYTFAAGAAEYATISLKKPDNSNITADELTNITVTFA